METRNVDVIKELEQHKKWLEEPPVITAGGNTEKLIYALGVAVDLLKKCGGYYENECGCTEQSK